MSFWSNAKDKVMQAVKPRQQENQGYTSQRADGSTSGYVPGLKPQAKQQDQNGERRNNDWRAKVPGGVDIGSMQPQQVGGQTGQMNAQQGGIPQPGMPQQPAGGQTGYHQQMNRPQAQFNGTGPVPQQPVQPQQAPFAQPVYQQQPVQPQQGGYSVPQQPMMTQQPASQSYPFGGGDSFVADGNAYKMVMRVAQITGVPSCFRVIEFMYNNEAVIVNAEQITDLVEADRCMDLIFGAACAMKQRLMRVSGKQIYLITPPQVYVAPFDNLRRAGMADIERRWPGALQANMQPQQMGAQPFMNNVQPLQQPGFGQKLQQEDFAAGAGRRAARNAMHTNGYTDYGGFGVKSR